VYVFLLCKGGVGITVATLMLTGQIIDNNTFSGMMLMALALTAITKPAIWAILRWFPGDADPFDLQVGKTPGLSDALETLGPAPYDEELAAVVKSPEGTVRPDTLIARELGDQEEEDPRLPNPYAFLTRQGDRVVAPYLPDYHASPLSPSSRPELPAPHASCEDFQMSGMPLSRSSSLNTRVVKNY